jgi:MFS family permease
MKSLRISRYRWVVLAVYMVVAALTQLFWLNFAAIDTFIEQRLNISASSTMWLTLVFPLMQVALTLPAGLVIDRKGFKYGITIGALLTGVFALVRLINPESFTVLLISQLGIAAGQPFVINGVTKLAVTWFPEKEEATAVGLGSLALFVGMMISLGATPSLVQNLGYQPMLLIYAIFGVVGALLFIFLAKHNPDSMLRETEPKGEVTGWREIRVILKNRNFIYLGFIAFIGIGVFNGLATWLEKILNEMHLIPMTDAGTISAVLVFAGMIGCIVIPMLSDRFQRRKPFLILAVSIGIICIVMFMLVSNYWVDMVNSIILGFFFLAALPIMLVFSAEITGPRYAGISVGYLQFLGNVAAVVIIVVMETLRSTTGQFLGSLLFLAVLLLGCLTMSILIQEARR